MGGPLLTPEKYGFHFRRSPWNSPGGPGVKTLPSSAGGAGSISGLGAKVSHALWPKRQNIRHSSVVANLNKEVKSDLH